MCLNIAIALALQSTFALADGCSPYLLEKAKADIYQTVKKSANHKPISQYLAETEFKTQAMATSNALGDLGVIQFATHIKTGKSRLELLNEKAGTRTTLFTTEELEPTKKSGRIASIRLSEDARELIIDFRAYTQPGHEMVEIRRKLPSQAPLQYAGAVLIDPRRVMQSISLKDGGKVMVVNYGMNASTDVNLIDSKGHAQLLFTTFRDVRNNSVQFKDVTVSPSGRFIVFRSYKNGSLDEFDLEAFDVQLDRVVHRAVSGPQELTWLDDGALRYQRYSKEPGQEFVVADLDAIGGNPVTVRAAPKEIPDFYSEIGRIGDEIYYIAGDWRSDAKEIRAVSIEARKRGDGSRARRVIGPSSSGMVLDGAKILGDTIVASFHKGPRKARTVVDTKGRTLVSFWLPDFCSLNWMVWKTKGETLTLSLASALNPNVQVDLDIKKMTYSDASFESKLLTYNGKSYVSEIVNVTSFDGTQVPVRITRLKDLALNGDHPVYLTVYGGFGIENSGFSPVFDSIAREFLERGGLIVSPGVRGGNEYGEAWHQAGAGMNKKNTFADVAATAQYMIQKGWTKSKKIILSGTSNGGLTTAASALLYPDLFGLVIPINGVLDLERAEAWDRKFGGWSYEYGENANAGALANKQNLSPMVRAQRLSSGQEMPEFFIVNGEDDSRVSAQHSHGFYATLAGKGSDEVTARMLVLPHAGHWLASPAYQKSIGWHTKAVIWTRIYDYLGWTF